MVFAIASSVFYRQASTSSLPLTTASTENETLCRDREKCVLSSSGSEKMRTTSSSQQLGPLRSKPNCTVLKLFLWQKRCDDAHATKIASLFLHYNFDATKIGGLFLQLQAYYQVASQLLVASLARVQLVATVVPSTQFLQCVSAGAASISRFLQRHEYLVLGPVLAAQPSQSTCTKKPRTIPR